MSAADAVDELYRVHAVGLIRFAVLLVGDKASAEDVVQDAFLGLYRAWRRLHDPGNAAGYLRVAVVNGCRSALRGRSRARLLRVLHDPPVWSAEAAAMDSEDRRALLAAVARLPRRQREVLALRYYLGLGEREIAAALAVSRGTCPPQHPARWPYWPVNLGRNSETPSVNPGSCGGVVGRRWCRMRGRRGVGRRVAGRRASSIAGGGLRRAGDAGAAGRRCRSGGRYRNAPWVTRRA